MFGLGKKKTEKIDTNPQKIEELLTRGVENIFPNKDFLMAKMLRGEKLTLYLGIDPTGQTLHLGHVIPLLRLAVFQKLGHQVILLMGDFTAMIGDPTDKTATRKKLSRKEVLNNLSEYKKQASRFLSFSGKNKALFKFNSEWLDKVSFGDALEIASFFTVDQMLKRDMFVRRAEEGKPVYMHEFMYPLMQGYDSVAMDVDGEIGGNDQTFNMLVGRDLMKSLKNKEKFVIATKLLTDSSGKKMGKTENNMVALDQSPEEMFGRIMSWSDNLIIPGLEIITDIKLSEIESIQKDLNEGKNPKDIKTKLAFEIVKMYHGESSAKKAQETFENTFSKGGVPEDVLEVFASSDTLLVDTLLAEKIISSKTDFRRLIAEGAITNMDTGEKISDTEIVSTPGIYKIGKKRFIKIKSK